MELVDEFTVPAPPSQAWTVLSDIERIAPCLPGAVLEERRGEAYLGRVGLRIGPVGLSFAGRADVVERDDEAHRLVVRGSAQDAGGQGGAEALITVSLSEAPADESTGPAACRVRVVTQLTLSGRVAQFGAGPITQVNRRVLGQFVKRLHALVLADQGGVQPAAAPGETARPLRERLFVLTQPAGAGDRSQLVPALLTALSGVLLGVSISRAARSWAKAGS